MTKGKTRKAAPFKDMGYQATECDSCGVRLATREHLTGLCSVCERAWKVPKKRRETVKLRKGL